MWVGTVPVGPREAARAYRTTGPVARRIRCRCNHQASRNRESRSTRRRRTEAAQNRPTNGVKAK
jgi:hypothetical protein